MDKINYNIQSEYKNISPDLWLTEILRQQVYRLAISDQLIGDTKARQDLTLALTRITRIKPLFLYAKVATASINAARFLEEKGFYLVDTNIVFEKTNSTPRKLTGNCELRFAVSADEKQVVKVAGKSFTYSRFHLDKAFSAETANIIKAEWARNFFNGSRGQAMVVALINKEIIGFLQLLQGGEGMLTIDLIAVAGGFRRQGIASDMIAYAQAHCQNVRQLKVGTQIANIASIRLYEGMDFKVAETQYIFHYHNH